VILGLDEDPRTAMPKAAAADWERFGARFLTIRPGALVVEGEEIGDPTGQLWNAMTTNGVRFIVVRPDRYVFAAAADARSIVAPMSAAHSRPTW
jgi:3-(3-hydroxy-phenyl)propionate hydroxylase